VKLRHRNGKVARIDAREADWSIPNQDLPMPSHAEFARIAARLTITAA
jgi:hypothetical protein